MKARSKKFSTVCEKESGLSNSVNRLTRASAEWAACVAMVVRKTFIRETCCLSSGSSCSCETCTVAAVWTGSDGARSLRLRSAFCLVSGAFKSPSKKMTEGTCE